MTPRQGIRRELVESLAQGETIWDSDVRGFGCRRQRRDAFYIVKYRDLEGRQRLVTIGRHGSGEWMPDRARKEAIRIKGLVRDGRDPAVTRDGAKRVPTLAEFAHRYLAEYSAAHHKLRTRLDHDSRLDRQILPALGTLKLTDIGRADVARFHASLRAAPVAANRAVDLLSAIMGWAERVGERPDHSNPCRYVEQFPEKPRERLLVAAELARLGDVLDTSHEDWRAVAAVRLLCFTGARVSEVLSLQWRQIEAPRGVARLPDSKTGAKNLYLPPAALSVLDALPRVDGSAYVLPGDRLGQHFTGLSHPWGRIRAAAGLDGVRPHDLRHMVASVAVASGDSLYIVGKVLGHRQASTTQRYSHLGPDPVLAVATRTATRIADMMRGGRQPGDGEAIPHPATGRNP